MKITLMVAVISMILVTACKQLPEKNTVADPLPLKSDTGSVKTLLATHRDVACGMNISDDVVDTAHYKGKVYGFCSPSCKKDFQSSPETYIAQNK